MVLDSGARVPFGRIADMEQWSSWIRQKNTVHMRFIFEGKSKIDPADESMIKILLPLVYIRKGSADPVDNRFRIKEKDLIMHCQQLLGDFKSPSKIHFLNKMPKGSSGKIQRFKIKSLIYK